ncbi:MAG TPA: signal peptide peptidase SppA [Chloroflexi bacterium]|jgi:protease-4|nr:signal peptide peptidase SppA [Chloroflexota bacterium]
MARRNRTWVIVAVALALLICCGGATLVGLAALGSLTSGSGLSGLGGSVAVIPVRGVIMSGGRADGFASDTIAYADRVIADIEAAEADPTIRAIVLEVNSPGGGVTPSAQIYRALRQVTKPMVTSMGEVAASGGYYIACATSQIVTLPETLTGSIGVRWEFTNAEELLDTLGVEVEVIKSGPHKDQGGLYRGLTEEERAIYQSIVDEAYADFVAVVAEGRNLPVERVRELADGRVYSGRQALELGLADVEGDMDTAIALAAAMAGIEGEPHVRRFERPVNPFRSLWGVAARLGRPAEVVLLEELLESRTPRLLYLYAVP